LCFYRMDAASLSYFASLEVKKLLGSNFSDIAPYFIKETS